MKRAILFSLMAALALAVLPSTQAQKYPSTPVDMTKYWNADGWYHDEADDPAVESNNPDAGGSWGLDGNTGGARIKISTLPAEVIPGKVNVTEDGEVAFLLPKMEIGDLDAYYPAGETITVPKGNYKYIYIACMSGNGNWPGSDANWAAVTDPATKKVTDPRSEVNSFKPIYDNGEGAWIPIGLVNDWFWKVPEWVAPTSGDANEIVADWLTYDADPDDASHLWDSVGIENHDYGQYHHVNGADKYFTYVLTIPAGLKKATLWTEMWGNVKVSIATVDDAAKYSVLYNSAKEDKVYGEELTASAGDGYMPNRSLRSFDLSTTLASGSVKEIYLKFEDAAPDIAYPWGARCHHLGLFKGDTKKSSLGARLWPGLVRTDNAKPDGGLILIKKKYILDEKRTLTSIKMPNLVPRAEPYLTVFGMTLAVDPAAPVKDFMLY